MVPSPVRNLMWAKLLYVDRPVAALQFDVETTGDIYPAHGLPKTFNTNLIAPGVVRILIWSVQPGTFIGVFAEADAPITSIQNIVSGDIYGNGLNAEISIQEYE
jgi:hypothetical protein